MRWLHATERLNKHVCCSTTAPCMQYAVPGPSLHPKIQKHRWRTQKRGPESMQATVCIKQSSGTMDDLLGKLKALGDKIEVVASNVGKEVVSGVKTGVTTVGTGVISVAKDIKDNVFENEFDKIRSVQQFQRSQSLVPKRKQFSEQEMDAADQRAAVVLDKLPQGYFDKDYDPVRHELTQLSDSSEQEDMDAIVDRLGTCMEAVSGKLSRHVMKKRDQLIVGIDMVATVEDDLKATLATARSGRSTVRQAADEVQRHLRVAGQTRRKQVYMRLMEVLSKIKQARDLQKQLRRTQENGEYHAAILLCVQCFQGVESLRNLTVSRELLSTVQRLYVDTLHKLDAALTAICAEFDTVRYTKVLDAYLLQSITGDTLAERVLQSFRDALHDSSHRAVRSVLLTQPQLVSQLAGGSAALDGSFTSLCSALPPGLVLSALTQVMEVCLSCMASYHSMALWHTQCVEATQQQTQGAELDEASATSLSLLAAVSTMMSTSRAEVFTCALNRVCAMIKLPAATAGNHILQAAEHCHHFLAAGEAFTRQDVSAGRDQVGAILGAAFEACHHGNMKTLSQLMQGDAAWRNVGGPSLAHEVAEGSMLLLPQVLGPPPPPPATRDAQQQQPTDFATWCESGSPFQDVEPISTSLCPPTPSAAAAPEHQEAGQVQPPMLTAAAQHMLVCLKAYGYLYKAVGPSRAGTIWQATTQLFDRFLAATFMLMSGIGMDTLVMQDDIMTWRLQRTLLRIFTTEGSRYKAQIEELMRTKALQGGSRGLHAPPAQATGVSWLDRFGDKMESLAYDLDRSVSKLSAAIGDKAHFLGAEGNPTLSPAMAASLQERLVAGESLVVVAQELRAGRQTLIAILHAASAAARAAGASAVAPAAAAAVPAPPAPAPAVTPSVRLRYDGMESILAAQQRALQSLGGGEEGQQPVGPPPMSHTSPTTGREADQYFGRVVEAAWDLREVLIQGVVRSLLGRLLDPERGIVSVVCSVPAYSGRDPPVNHNAWADAVGHALRGLAGALGSTTDLPARVQDQMWISAASLISDALTTGFSKVKKCTLEGRAAMSMDLSAVEKSLRAVVPPGASAACLIQLRRTDAYVRAFYLPWDELSRWCQLHFAEYSLWRLLPLIDQAADVHKVKRAAKAELLELLDALTADMA